MSRIYVRKDLTNKNFGYLKVIKENHCDLNHRRYWLCQCICGDICIIRGDRLTDNNNKISCGCKTSELLSLGHIQPNEESNVSRILRQYKKRGIQSGKGFSLSRDEFKKLIFSNCFYCGSPPSNIQKVDTKFHSTLLHYNGIDRLDSSLGYHKNNCVPCCIICNIAKSDMSITEFFDWIVKVLRFQLYGY